jgi:hypothetical protein
MLLNPHNHRIRANGANNLSNAVPAKPHASAERLLPGTPPSGHEEEERRSYRGFKDAEQHTNHRKSRKVSAGRLSPSTTRIDQLFLNREMRERYMETHVQHEDAAPGDDIEGSKLCQGKLLHQV